MADAAFTEEGVFGDDGKEVSKCQEVTEPDLPVETDREEVRASGAQADRFPPEPAAAVSAPGAVLKNSTFRDSRATGRCVRSAGSR